MFRKKKRSLIEIDGLTPLEALMEIEQTIKRFEGNKISEEEMFSIFNKILSVTLNPQNVLPADWKKWDLNNLKLEIARRKVQLQKGHSSYVV